MPEQSIEYREDRGATRILMVAVYVLLAAPLGLLLLGLAAFGGDHLIDVTVAERARAAVYGAALLVGPLLLWGRIRTWLLGLGQRGHR